MTVFFHRCCLCFVLVLGANVCFASAFGIIDPRGMAMGGTGVASSNSATGGYYNPALMAIYNNIKEKNNDSRFSSPLISARVTTAVEDFADWENNNFEDRVTNSINTFNAAQTPANAAVVANVAQDFENALDSLSDNDQVADALVGIVIGIAGNQEGGSFYLTYRGVAAGRANVTAQDRQLLDDYVAEMTAVSAGAAPGATRPNLYNGGQLLDQTDTLASSGDVRGLLTIESGVAMGWEVNWFNMDFLVGATPKVQVLSTYDFNESFNNTNPDVEEESKRKFRLNLDVGFAKDLWECCRVGVTVKNLIPRTLRTTLGREVEMIPQTRAGFLYATKRWNLAADLDLYPDETLGSVVSTQYFALGAEFKAASWAALRAGFRQNVQNTNSSGPFSLGVGFLFKRVHWDLAYITGEVETGAAMQIGFYF